MAWRRWSVIILLVFAGVMPVFWRDAQASLSHNIRGLANSLYGYISFNCLDDDFAGRFPFIDLKSGGSVAGYIENTRQLIARIDDNTKVIPGHGDLTNKAGLQQSLQMMEETLALVQSYKKAGLSLEQAIAKGLGDKYKGWHWNFITEKRWIETLYQA